MPKSEAQIQAEVRLETSQKHGVVLWRNNVGVMIGENGQPTRFGLGNESKVMNDNIKSSDLIGWTRIAVTPEMVGKILPIFTSIEVKREGYYPSGKREHEHIAAQQKWCDGVLRDGGIAGIVDSAEKAGQLVVEWLERMKNDR